MKITCILASFNRPTWIQHSLSSVFLQTYKDYELIVIDESDAFDIHSVVGKFVFSEVKVVHHDVTPEERARVNRLSVNVNEGLRMATGDLICYLADDDFYYPNWFSDASCFFKAHPGVHAGFGKLRYTGSRGMEYPKAGEIRFFSSPIRDPYCRLDHNQIIHRKLVPPIAWNEELHSVSAPDGVFMRAVGARHQFYPIDAFAAVKRMHGKNLQHSVPQYLGGKLKGTRE